MSRHGTLNFASVNPSRSVPCHADRDHITLLGQYGMVQRGTALHTSVNANEPNILNNSVVYGI